MALQTISLQTPEGIKAYPFAPTGDAYEAAIASGEIKVGDIIVYRNHLVVVCEDWIMADLDTICQPPIQNGGWTGDNNNGWSFTINGVPVGGMGFN